MNRNRIRLSESQLRRVIKESVKKVLREQLYEMQINELDPRTYASYAYKRQAQGGLLNQWKAVDGKQAAIDAWNKQYGKNTDNYNNSRRVSRQRFMGNDYDVQDNVGDFGPYGQERRVSQRNYNPHNDTCTYQNDSYDYNGNGKQTINQGQGAAGKGEMVARQMAQGNGKYIKGQGWQ